MNAKEVLTMKMNKVGLLCISLFALVGVTGCDNPFIKDNDFLNVEFNYGNAASAIRQGFEQKLETAVRNTSWKGFEYKGKDSLAFELSSGAFATSLNVKSLEGSITHETQMNVELSKDNFVNKKYDDLLKARLTSAIYANVETESYLGEQNALKVDARVLATYGKSNLTINNVQKEDAYAFLGFNGTLELPGEEPLRDYKTGYLVSGLTTVIEEAMNEIENENIDIEEMIPQSTLDSIEEIIDEVGDKVGFAIKNNEYYLQLNLSDLNLMEIMSDIIPDMGEGMPDLSFGIDLTGSLLVRIGFDDNGWLNLVETRVENLGVSMSISSMPLFSIKGTSEVKVSSYDGTVASVTDQELKDYNWNEENYLDIGDLILGIMPQLA